jgi:hypothetical protein
VCETVAVGSVGLAPAGLSGVCVWRLLVVAVIFGCKECTALHTPKNNQKHVIGLPFRPFAMYTSAVVAAHHAVSLLL